MKIAVITCYDQVNYVRAQTLRAAIAACPGVEMITVRNTRRGYLRYLEVPLKIIVTRILKRPDAYVIIFRGYEMLPLTLLVKGRKPLIFDEYVNAAEYLEEHGVLKLDSRFGRVFAWWYALLLKRCRFILADTEAHAAYSAQICNLPLQQYRSVPVGTVEALFRPDAAKHLSAKNKVFRVFYYGQMIPLQGMAYILDAAVQLGATHPHIEFIISGGKQKGAEAVATAQKRGAHITFREWTPFDKIPEAAITADLTLGGPFGNTRQGQLVIATKTFQFLACAAPVVIGRNRVMSEGFVDKKNCLVVPQGDAMALAHTIAWASEHPSELPAIGKAGRKLYEAHFSQATIQRIVEAMVEEVRV